MQNQYPTHVAHVVANNSSWITGLFRVEIVEYQTRRCVYVGELSADNIQLLYGSLIPPNAFDVALAQWRNMFPSFRVSELPTKFN